MRCFSAKTIPDSFTHTVSRKHETDPDFKKQSFASEEIREDVSANDKMQTFVFSATLSKDLQRNLKKRQKARVSKKGDPPASTLGAFSCSLRPENMSEYFLIFSDDLVLRLDFRDPEPEVMDLSPVGGVVSTLNESKIECMSGDKVRGVDCNRSFCFVTCADIFCRTLIFITFFCVIRVARWSSSLPLTASGVSFLCSNFSTCQLFRFILNWNNANASKTSIGKSQI